MAAAMSALPVTLLLVTVLLAFSQPALGYRRGLSTTGGLITHNLGRQLLQEGSDNPCGQFPADDPFDGARNGQTPNWRQPCRDEAGVVQFCCSSGTTQCACPPNPPTAAGPFTCFNYNAGNSLNANTGAQCGFTLPGSSGSPSPTSATPSPTSATPSPTSATPSPTSATPSPTTATPSPTSTTPPSTSLPTSAPGGPCISSPRGSPGADGTCGNDPAGQAYNLCETMAGIQFCCPMGFTCPTADPVTASNPNFALQVYCQAEGPCTESPTSAPGTSSPTNAPTTSAPTTNAPATNAPTSGPPSGCQTVPSSGSPGVDGTCGYDPSGQAFNLCSTAGGIQFCCPQGFICPIAGSVAPSGSSSALQVFCQVPGPCGY